MFVAILLLLFSAGLLGLGLLAPDRVPMEILWLALIGFVLALLRLLLWRRRGPARPGKRGGSAGPMRVLIVDGSNVMHWRNDIPQLATVRETVDRLSARGFVPGVIFDANAGYKLTGRYQGAVELSRLLGLPHDRVLVVPKGKQADPFILQYARDLGARVVSQDRFRDRAAEFPEVATPGFLVRGGYRDGALWLDEAALGGPLPA